MRAEHTHLKRSSRIYENMGKTLALTTRGRFQKKAFTLAEALVSSVVMAILLSGLFAVFLAGEKGWHSDISRVDLQQTTRLALFGMSRELRQTSADTLSLPQISTITFSLPNVGNSITYSFDAAKKQIIRQHPAGVTQVIGRDIQALSFSCLDINNAVLASNLCGNAESILIQITAQKEAFQRSVSFALQKKVKLRNE